MGEVPSVGQLEVHWPSGKVSTYQGDSPIRSGQLVTVYENPGAAPQGQGFQITPYEGPKTENQSSPGGPRMPELADKERPFTLLVAMATWCESCKAGLPQLALLGGASPQVSLLGFPWDPEDSEEKLRAYEQKFQPAYRLLSEPQAQQRKRVEAAFRMGLEEVALPSSVLLDSEGRVLAYYRGLPTLSELRVATDPERRKALAFPSAVPPPVDSYSHPQARVTARDIQEIFTPQ